MELQLGGLELFSQLGRGCGGCFQRSTFHSMLAIWLVGIYANTSGSLSTKPSTIIAVNYDTARQQDGIIVSYEQTGKGSYGNIEKLSTVVRKDIKCCIYKICF